MCQMPEDAMYHHINVTTKHHTPLQMTPVTLTWPHVTILYKINRSRIKNYKIREKNQKIKMKFCNDCAVPESSKCLTVECPPACDGGEQQCPCFNFDCFKAGKSPIG